jgi:hypothetical protein
MNIYIKCIKKEKRKNCATNIYKLWYFRKNKKQIFHLLPFTIIFVIKTLKQRHKQSKTTNMFFSFIFNFNC